MRIHLQNQPNDPLFDFSQTMWDEAAARAGETGHAVSIGITEADFATAMTTAEALVCDASVLKRRFPCPAPHLKLIFATNAGLDRLAPYDWLPPGAILMNNRGTHEAKAGEFGLMAVLMLANRIPEMATNQWAGRWQKLWGSVLASRRITIVGLGALGGTLAGHATRFGMQVTGVRNTTAPHPDCARVLTMEALDSVLPDTDILVLACPLTARTRGLMDRNRLSRLPAGAGIVNIGRGELLDQDALCDMLDSGHIGGAVLDVFTPEPLPPGHRLWTTPHVVISPHTSADDPATYNPRSLDIFLANLRAHREGKPLPNQFDIARGY